MAVIETKIYSTLGSYPIVAEVASSRIYPLVIPQDPTFPVVTYQRISGQRINTLQGMTSLENSHILINSYATRYDEVKGLAAGIAAAMNGSVDFKGLLVNDLDGYDPDTGLFFVTQDFSCWYQTDIERLTNGGFETLNGASVDDDGTSDTWDGWTAYPYPAYGAILESVTDQKHSGNRCVKFTTGAMLTDAQIAQTFAIDAGRYLTLRFWARGDGSVAGRYAVDYSGGTILAATSTGVSTTTWTMITYAFTVPAGGSSVTIWLAGPTLAGCVWYDDVSCFG